MIKGGIRNCLIYFMQKFGSIPKSVGFSGFSSHSTYTDGYISIRPKDSRG